jgi:CelD/BcsL family acetyltransferase involved in cellulose biosynthesis
MESRILPWPVSPGLVHEWDALVDDTGGSPFVRPGWIRAWWGAFGRGRLEVIAVRDAGSLAAVLPTVRTIGGRTSPTNWHTPRFGVVARDDAARDDAARALFATKAPHVSMSFLAAEDPSVGAIRAAARAARYRVVERTLARPYVVDLDGDWDSYRRVRLGKELVSKLGRTRRRLDEVGDVAFEMSDGGDRMDDVLSEIVRVEGSGWKAARGTAIRSRPDTLRFYRDVAGWARGRGTLALSVLRVDGNAVAGEMAVVDGGRHVGLKAGFDQRFARFGPGMLLLHEVLREDFDRGLKVFDFAGDDAEWKARWATGRYELIRLQAFAPTSMGTAHRAAHRYGRPALLKGRRAVDGVRARWSRRT